MDVDAFLSHSWHDSGSAKWAALQAWAEAFERAHGRRPTIWLDKACIDQQNIQASLAGLPVYLSGCDSMLVLIGKTYLSRLWCIMEVFTFLVLGSDAARLKLIRILDDAGDVGDALDGFAASRARCFLAEDRERLLGVIESGFGNLDAFDLAVRGMLAQNDQTKEYESSIRRRLDAREHLAVARRGVMSAVRVMRAGRGLVPRESSVAAEVASPPPRQRTRRSTRASWWNRRSRASRGYVA